MTSSKPTKVCSFHSQEKRKREQEAVKRYILEQEGKDVFEYSIFGDPTGQTKIGDFSEGCS